MLPVALAHDVGFTLLPAVFVIVGQQFTTVAITALDVAL